MDEQFTYTFTQAQVIALRAAVESELEGIADASTPRSQELLALLRMLVVF